MNPYDDQEYRDVDAEMMTEEIQQSKQKRRNKTYEDNAHFLRQKVAFSHGYLVKNIKKEFEGPIRTYRDLAMNVWLSGTVTDIPKSAKNMYFAVAMAQRNVMLKKVTPSK
jgi:hypothetical protein